MSAPRVSVLLPARDAAATLGAALASLARQSEHDWECVLVDDGSVDATGELARDFARRDPRLRVLDGGGRGLVPALEQGRGDCRAELVARFDADDLMHRHRLAAQLAALQAHPELAAVGCRVRYFPRRGLSDGMAAYERWLNDRGAGADLGAADVRREAFVECPLGHPTWMLRRAVLDAHGWRDRGWPEDHDLLLRLLGAGHALGVVPRRLHLWRDGPDRHSRTDPAYAPGRFAACKAHHLARGLLAGRDDYVLWGHGPTGRRLRKALAAEGRHASHVVEVHPRRVGQVLHGAPVVAVEELDALVAGVRDAGRAPRLVAAVSGPAARRLIRARLDGLGLEETVDYVVAA